MVDIIKVRQQFPFLTQGIQLNLEHSGRKRIFLDNTASTQPATEVLAEMCKATFGYANIHRGAYEASQKSTEEFERTYNIAANVINANSWREIILGRNTTEMINLVMRGLADQVRSGDNIVVSALEHNSNYVPWHGLQGILQKRGVLIEVKIAPFNHQTGELDYPALEKLIDNKTKLVGITGASNFLGTKPDLKHIAHLAHNTRYIHPDGRRGSYFLVDGAQLVPATPVDVQEIDCDFLAWSFHKMTLPFGVGALYGKKEILETFDPFLYGGDMITDVKPGKVEYQDLPWRFTAGTPNILGTITTGYGMIYLMNLALGNIDQDQTDDQKAQCILNTILLNTPRGDFDIKYTVPSELKDMFGQYLHAHPNINAQLRDPQQRKSTTQQMVKTAIGVIEQHERELTQYALDELQQIQGVTVYGPKDATKRAGLVALSIEGITSQVAAIDLNRQHIEMRSGTHCASLAHHYLGLEGSVRMSFHLYTSKDDVAKGIAAVQETTHRARNA